MFFLYNFSLLQITTPVRMVALLVVALFPLGLTLGIYQLLGGNSSVDLSEVATNVILSFVIPVVAILSAIPAFSHEIDDKTLSYITLSPMERWRIVVAKMGASFTLGLPFAIISILVALPVAGFLGGSGPFSSFWQVILGSLLGLATYTTIMVWIGMKFIRPFAVALIYIFVWELGLSLVIDGFLGVTGGFVYVTVRGQMASIVDSSDVNVWVAFAGVIVLFILFSYLSIRRMKTMEVP